MRIAGVPVRVRPAFLLIAFIIGTGPGRTPETVIAWLVIVTVSILVHEAGHAAAFVRFGHDAEITLTGYGGLTAGRPRPGHEPLTNGQHIVVSFAGPAAGLALGLLALSLQRGLDPAGADEWLDILVLVNIGWGLLNLLPILPLDGGQVMGSVLSIRWRAEGRRIAAGISAAIAAVISVVAIASGYTVGGIMAGILVGMNLGEMRSGGGTPDPRGQIDRAARQMQEGNWEQAIAMLRDVLAGKLAPGLRTPASQLLAWALLGAGRYEAVDEWVNRERFNHMPVRTVAGVSLLARGEPEAIPALASALGTEPVDPPGWSAAFFRGDLTVVDQLASQCEAQPSPQGAVAMAVLTSWLHRGSMHHAALRVAVRTTNGPAGTAELAATAASAARSLGLDQDARQWDELAFSLPRASPRG